MDDQASRRYVIMPKHGFSDPELKTVGMPGGLLVTVRARAQALGKPTMRVLDAIGPEGPRLVEMPPEGELSLRLSFPGLMIVPLDYYHRLSFRPEVKERVPRRRTLVRSKSGKARGAARVRAQARPGAGVAAAITVVDRTTGNPLRGAHVVVFTDYANRIGEEANSGADGVARLAAISPRQVLQRAYIYGPPGYWGYYEANATAAALKTVELRPIDLANDRPLLGQLYGTVPADAGTNITVAVIDTGIDSKHPALTNVVGGLNCVSDETRGNPDATQKWGPARIDGEHGTHVAGIIGANGDTFRGVAPRVQLRSYRVFPDGGGLANSFDIARAIDAATTDGCHLINMSLGGGPANPAILAAIDRALAAGTVVIAAAGNDYRKPVAYPGAFPECVTVSAMGRRKSFPRESTGTGSIEKPNGGANQQDFIADFSNFGPEIDVTCCGVEIISTLPGEQYGPMSGTSMATPAVTGFAAYLIAVDPNLLKVAGSARSQQIKDLLYSRCKPQEFGRDYEGFGLPVM
jgi:subtilisin